MEATTHTQSHTENTVSNHSVDIPQNVLGSAAPPLYDGFRALFAETLTVSLDKEGIHTRAVSERIRNCAARMLCFINFCLKANSKPEEGLKYSRPEFQDLFRNEYSLDIIEVAQVLIISLGFVSPPCQDGTTERAFSWKINGMRLREAFDSVAATQAYKRVKKRKQRSNRSHVTLVSTTGNNTSTDALQKKGENTSQIDELSHDQKSLHGKSDIDVSTQGHQVEEAKTSFYASSDITACNTKITQGDVDASVDTLHPPSKKEYDGLEENISPLEVKEDAQKYDVSFQPMQPEAVVTAFSEAPKSPETVLAFFDQLRGYSLTDGSLKLAQEKAYELCYGNEEIQRPGYSFLAIMLTAVYLLKHDPKWQENFEKYCGRTGIPEVWSVNKWIGAKWPLAKRRCLNIGEYIELDDGTLLSQAQYQVLMKREREEWRTEQERWRDSTLQSQESSVEPDESDVVVITTSSETEMLVPALASSEQELEVVDGGKPIGWTSATIAGWHAKRLSWSLPPYFVVEVQPIDEQVHFGIVIKNACLEDDTEITLLCNKEVCTFLEVIREERTREGQESGWIEVAIAYWWTDTLLKKLPSDCLVEVCLNGDRYVIEIDRLPQNKGCITLANNSQVEAFLLALASDKTEQKTRRGGLGRRKR